jgi:uncharacterized membrane protein
MLVGILELLGLGVWIGTILFFSTVAAPTAFHALDNENAGAYIRAVFPRYYAFGLVLGVVTLGSGIVARVLSANWGALSLLTLALTGVMLATTAYAHVVLRPQIEVLRETRASAAEGTPEYDAANEGFRTGHLLSVILNLLVLLLGIALFVVLSLSRRA